MASSVTDYCTLCNDDGTSTEAVRWCIECEVYLCTDCEKHHKKSRSSKVHNTMSTKDYHNLPKFMKEISSQCRDHMKKYELYCSFHACPCCVTCITDKHKKCQEMKPLSDILKKVKSSASVQLFEKDLREVRENLEEIIKHLNLRINTSTIQNTKAAEQIRSMRKSIDDFLDKLEQEILDDLDLKQSKLKSEMDTLLQQLKKQANQMRQLQSEFSKMQYATELQMYVGLREIEKTTSEAAKYLEDLKSGGQLDEVNLELTISSKLQSILKDVKSFGDININTSPFTLQLKAVRKDQAQYLVPTIPTIEQIKSSFLRQLTIPEDMKSINIRACSILPDGKYLILKNRFRRSNLLLFSNDGMFIREVVKFTEHRSWDSCFVTNNTVVAALYSDNQIAQVDVEKNKILKSINLSHFCISVASDGQMLVISSTEMCTIVNLNNESHTILEGVVADKVALFKGNIYGTICSENKVCCYKSTGEPLWTFMHDDIDNPQGIALDKNGFVYVVSTSNNRVVVVSPDGKTCKTILSEADGIKSLFAIDIDRELGIMIVSSKIRVDNDDREYESTAFVYKI